MIRIAVTPAAYAAIAATLALTSQQCERGGLFAIVIAVACLA
jgi:hypothetical protein